MPDVDPKDLPRRDGDVPLHELTRDQLSAFLYLAFTGEELLQLLRQAGVSLTGGYRLESLDDVGRADVLADELRAAPAARGHVLPLLRQIYEFPALESVVLPKVVADELAALASEADAAVRLMWRLLVDPSKEIRQSAGPGLDALAGQFFGAPEAGAEGAAPSEPAPVAPAPSAAGGSAALQRLRKEAKRAGSQAAKAQERAAALKEQLKVARAEVVRLGREAAARAKQATKLGGELEKAKARLTEGRKKGTKADLARLQKERDDLAARAGALEERAREAAAERHRLGEALAEAQRKSEAAQHRTPPQGRFAAEPAPTAESETPEEPPATWLLPRYTREFYDSLEGWDPRIQRAAFKQASLLAENHRHPSLRAIPLEGLPGYYRVRIATDVRLIYRRGESEREVELLSLIDREDLDRYVRQAKTR